MSTVQWGSLVTWHKEAVCRLCGTERCEVSSILTEVWLGLGNLRTLALNDNAFTGGVPRELGALLLLSQLYIYRNMLSCTFTAMLAGTILSELGRTASACSWP